MKAHAPSPEGCVSRKRPVFSTPRERAAFAHRAAINSVRPGYTRSALTCVVDATDLRQGMRDAFAKMGLPQRDSEA